MTNINNLFFELLRVAIGTEGALSRVPSPQEWKALYDMAKKQSLVGICFAGLQRLGADADSGFSKLGLTEMQYLTWMGMAAKIQQRNEVVNRQCVELCKGMEKEGFRACVLKGQGTAALYRAYDNEDDNDNESEEGRRSGESSKSQTEGAIGLCHLRQNGDIDVWVMPQDVRTISESRKRVNELVHRYFPEEEGAFMHIGFPVYKATEVEVHYVPTMDGRPKVNKRFERMFEEQQDACFGNLNTLGFAVPVADVNVLFNLHHIKRHFINEGIGLRHILDLYFVLKAFCCENSYDTESLRQRIDELGMKKFFSGMLWVMQEVLFNDDDNDDENLASKGNCNQNAQTSRSVGTNACLCKNLKIEPDERLGRFILQEIMQGGNFGHHDERLKGVNEMGFWKRWKQFLSVSFVRARYFPADVFWSYVFRAQIGVWRKTGVEI